MPTANAFSILNIISWLPEGGKEAFMDTDKSYPWPSTLFDFLAGNSGQSQDMAPCAVSDTPVLRAEGHPASPRQGVH